MKRKIIYGLMATAIMFSTTGCSSSHTAELESRIVTLQQENEKLTAENGKLLEENKKLTTALDTYVEKEEQIKAEKSKYKPINLGETVVVDGYGEFSIKSAELTQKVTPPNPDAFYSYYEVKDPNEIYLDVIMDFKNSTTIGIGADEVTSVKVIYGEGYEYSTFSAMEESGGSDFTYTNINKVEPLKSIRLHYLAELPIEAKTSDKSIKLQFTVYDSDYEVIVR